MSNRSKLQRIQFPLTKLQLPTKSVLSQQITLKQYQVNNCIFSKNVITVQKKNLVETETFESFMKYILFVGNSPSCIKLDDLLL